MAAIANKRESTRSEHLAWCKQRALKYLDGTYGEADVPQAWASMVSDLRQHPETEGHLAIVLGMQMVVAGLLSTPVDMRRFIEGFN